MLIELNIEIVGAPKFWRALQNRWVLLYPLSPLITSECDYLYIQFLQHRHVLKPYNLERAVAWHPLGESGSAPGVAGY